MAVKIKLKRMGKVRVPQYRIIVADSRTRRDGRAIEELGKYQPKEHPSLVEVNSERVQYWLGVGAQPTEPVLSLLKITGDWQRFKGLPGAENRVQSAAPKADKTEVFNAALAEVHGEPTAEATTSKKTTKKAAKQTAKKADTQADAQADAPADTAQAGGETGRPAKKSAAKKTTAKKTAKKAAAETESSAGSGGDAEADAEADKAAADEAGEPASES